MSSRRFVQLDHALDDSLFRNSLGYSDSTEIVGAQARDHYALPLRTGDEDMQPTPPAVRVNGSKVHAQTTNVIPVIADADDHRVPFVALDILQRLDEHVFVTTLFKEDPNVRPRKQSLCDSVFKCLLLTEIESDDPKRALRMRVKNVRAPIAQPSEPPSGSCGFARGRTRHLEHTDRTPGPASSILAAGHEESQQKASGAA